MIARVNLESGSRDERLVSSRRIAASSWILAQIEGWAGRGLESKMSPSERETATWQRGWGACWISGCSVVGAGEGGLGVTMGMSRSRSEVRSSEGSSEGRRDDIRGVGVDGGDGERKSVGGPRRGGGDGMGWEWRVGSLRGEGWGSWRMATAGMGMEMMLESREDGEISRPSWLSCWAVRGGTGGG